MKLFEYNSYEITNVHFFNNKIDSIDAHKKDNILKYEEDVIIKSDMIDKLMNQGDGFYHKENRFSTVEELVEYCESKFLHN